MKGLIYAAIGAYVVVISIMLFIYFRPKFINEKFTQEGFTTIAIDGEKIPKCFLRDAEAQRLLHMMHGLRMQKPSSEASMAYDELKLILQKALCLDADVTGPAAGPYSTYQFPFTTAHDIEPTANLVGRCTRHVARERDIDMVIEKYDYRGSVLINQLCDNNSRATALNSFHSILDRVKRNIMTVCVAPKANLDKPTGVRDPGYFESEKVKSLTPYTISGGGKQYF